MRSLRPARAHGTYVLVRIMMTAVGPAGKAVQGNDRIHLAKRTRDAVHLGTGTVTVDGPVPKRGKRQVAKAQIEAAFEATQRLRPSKGARRGMERGWKRVRDRASLSVRAVAAAAAAGTAVFAAATATWAAGLGDVQAQPAAGAAKKWAGDSFDWPTPSEALRWGTFNGQGRLGSDTSVAGHWSPLDKLLSETYATRTYMLIICDPGCSAWSLRFMLRESALAKAHEQSAGRRTAVFGPVGDTKAAVLILAFGAWIQRVQAVHTAGCDRTVMVRLAVGHRRLQVCGMYGWSGANTDLEVLHRNGLILDDIIGISNKCAGRGIDFILGGDTNIVVRERDIGAVLPECIDLMESFSTSTGLRSGLTTQ